MRKSLFYLLSLLITLSFFNSTFVQAQTDTKELEMMERLEILGFQIQKIEDMIKYESYGTLTQSDVTNWFTEEGYDKTSDATAKIKCYADKNEIVRKIEWYLDSGAMGGNASWFSTEFYFSITGKPLLIIETMALRKTGYLFSSTERRTRRSAKHKAKLDMAIEFQEWNVEKWEYTNPKLLDLTPELHKKVKKNLEAGSVIPQFLKVLLGFSPE